MAILEQKAEESEDLGLQRNHGIAMPQLLRVGIEAEVREAELHAPGGSSASGRNHAEIRYGSGYCAARL
jgi:hypothetical protein